MAAKKTETPEQMLARWMADPARKSFGYDELMARGWEPGQVGYIECYGMRWDRWPLDDGGFVVVEWDDGGNVSVA